MSVLQIYAAHHDISANSPGFAYWMTGFLGKTEIRFLCCSKGSCYGGRGGADHLFLQKGKSRRIRYL